MTATVKVHEVIYDTGRDGGPARDGTAIYRSRDKGEAERFAASHTCYGSPATVESADVSRKLAQRWGLA